MSTALSLNVAELEANLEDANKALHAYERFRLQHSFHAFVVWAWPLVEPDNPFVDNWHIHELCSTLERMTLPKVHARRLRRAVVNVPPGTMKSLLCSVFFPAWVWSKWPEKKFICASYSSLLSNRDNLKMRDLVTKPEYQALFPLTLHEDQKTKTRFNTDKGGYRLATSVEGGGTGEHPDFIIIDDPSTAAEAQSEAGRLRVQQWWKGTLATRGIGKGVNVLCVAQRLHEEDLPGYLLEQGSWYHICWPMRYMVTRAPSEKDPKGYTADPLDPRTREGELLFPALFDEQAVAQMEKDLGPYEAAGQLQQQPAPEGGGIFQRAWFKFIGALPALRKSCRGWDTAGTKDDGDWTAGVLIHEEFEKKIVSGVTMLVSTGRIIIGNCVRFQEEAGEVEKIMVQTAHLDGLAVAQREEREGGASGKGVIAGRAKAMAGIDYDEVHLGQNKVIRAKPLRTQASAGNVYLLRTGDPVRDAWIEPFLQELAVFPTGKNDDQVDGASCSYNSLVLMPAPKRQFAVW